MPSTTRTGPLATDRADAVRRLAGRAHEHDGVEALGEQTLLDLEDPGATDAVHVLATDEHGALVGYAALDPAGDPPSAELVVDPDHRRRGTGRRLLGAVRSAARELARPAPAVWAHGDLPAARALAAAAGLGVHRELWQMALDLRSVPSLPPVPDPPDGVTLRPFAVGRDEPAWLDLNARAFAWHPEQGRMTAADLRAREREPWFDAADLLLAERDGALVASLWMKVEPGARDGELYVLAVDPQAQGQGLGRLLTAVTVAHLVAKGLDRVVLYTEATNAGAVRTYRSAGFSTVRADVQHR